MTCIYFSFANGKGFCCCVFCLSVARGFSQNTPSTFPAKVASARLLKMTVGGLQVELERDACTPPWLTPCLRGPGYALGARFQPFRLGDLCCVSFFRNAQLPRPQGVSCSCFELFAYALHKAKSGGRGLMAALALQKGGGRSFMPPSLSQTLDDCSDCTHPFPGRSATSVWAVHAMLPSRPETKLRSDSSHRGEGWPREEGFSKDVIEVIGRHACAVLISDAVEGFTIYRSRRKLARQDD